MGDLQMAMKVKGIKTQTVIKWGIEFNQMMECGRGLDVARNVYREIIANADQLSWPDN